MQVKLGRPFRMRALSDALGITSGGCLKIPIQIFIDGEDKHSKSMSRIAVALSSSLRLRWLVITEAIWPGRLSSYPRMVIETQCTAI